MKKNLKLIGLATALFAVSAMNLKVVLNTEHSGDWSMISLAAIGEGGTGTEDGFPTDPFPGQGRDAESKFTINSYILGHRYLYTIGDDRYHQEYQYPTTQIICNGVGRVKCNDIFLIGTPEEVGIVKNPAL